MYNFRDDENNNSLVISASGVTVRYKLPKQVIRSFKEYLIHRIKAGRYERQEFTALENISIDVFEGQAIGVIGRNGAGKSTLLKVIAGIIRPMEGSVTVNGRIAPLIELGAGFDPELSGRENVYLNGSILGITNKELTEKMAGIVDFSELIDFIDSPLRTYSSGMMARLGFAIATDVDPDILIIDEILGVGDAAFQKKCRNRIDKFREGGVTVLMVSHNIHEVSSFCDVVYWLDRGEVKEWGPAKPVCQAYQKFYEL